MKLHLPKLLLTAVLAVLGCGGSQVLAAHAYISDSTTDNITFTSSDDRLLYDHTDADGLITFAGDIDLSTYSIWAGPGTNGANVASQSTRVELSGVISGSGTLKLNEYSNSNGHVVYVLSNTANTFSGTVHLGHGGGDSSYVQLSLTSDSLSSATVDFESGKAKQILSVEANATLAGLTNGNVGNLITSTSADNTLTLAGTGTYAYAGKIGSGNYIDSDSTSFTTSSSPSVASSTLNIAKSGSGTQTFSGTVNLGTVDVSAGTMTLSGTASLTAASVTGGTLNLSGTTTLTTADVTGGTLNLSGTSNGGTYTADGGTINVGALTVSSGTLSLSGSGAVLSQTVTSNAVLVVDGVTINDLSAFDASTSGALDTSAASGIQTLGTTYTLVKGSGTSSGTVVYDGITYNIADGIADTSDTYYVAAGDSISSTAEAAASADMFYTDGTLTIDGATSDALTVHRILTTTEGSGDIVLASEATLTGTESTLNTGKLILQDKLILGTGQAQTASIAGNSAIVFDGGSIEHHHVGATLNEVTVTANGGSLYSYDMGAKGSHVIKLAGTTTLSGDFTVSSHYNAQLEIEKLTGSGNLVFSGSGQNEALYAEITAVENYTGTVKVTGTSKNTYLTIAENLGVNVEYTTASGNDINLADIAAGNSVTLTGAKGWLRAGTSADLILTNTASAAGMEISNGSSNSVYTFSGAVSGTGNMVFNKALSGAMTLKFSGDVSDWSGLMIVRAGSNHVTYTGNATHVANDVIAAATGDSSKATTLTFDHASAATVDSTITNSYWGYSGTMNVSVSNTAAEGTTFNGAMTVNSLTVSADTLATIKGTAVVTTLTSNGTINVADAGSLTYAEKTKVEAASADSAAAITATTIDGAKVTFSGDDGVTESSAITNSVVDNQNTGIATVTLGAQNLSLLATNGNINAINTSIAEIASVTITAGKTVGVYTGTTIEEAAEGTLTTAALTVGGTDATLNANLVLSTGATVTLADALTMGSTLTLGTDMTLDGAQYTAIMNLAEDSTDTVALFTGVDALYLGGSSTASATLSETDAVALGTYFSNVTNANIYLGYDGGTVFAGVMTQSIPEPTSSMLGLVGLVALTFRRRRK